MRILKIANIANSRNSGMGRVMHCTADELRQLGHTVDMCFSSDVARPLNGRGDRFLFPIALVGAVRQLIRQHGKYDVVEIHEPSAAWYCRLRKRDKTLPPCVVMSHGSEGNYWRHRLALDRHLGRKTSLRSRISVPLTLLSQSGYGLRHSQQVMCLNSQDERFFRSRAGVPEAKISRIQHGVESHFFADRNTLKEGLPRLLFVGTWLDNKGRHIIPEAFRLLAGRHPGLKLSLLGTGFSAEEVANCFELRLRGSLTIRPRVDDAQLRAAYSEHDILLLPSFFESWGLVLLEAAAARLAIVSSKAGGPSEIFQDQKNALLVPATDLAAFTDAISALLQDRSLLDRLGDMAQERARQLTWAAAAQSHLRAYEKAMQQAAIFQD